MSSHDVWTIQCQETNDGSGDLIINLPSELLNQMALAIGDDLTVDVVGHSIILRPTSDLATRQARIGVAARQNFSRTYRDRLRYLLNISTDATDEQLHELVETGLTWSTFEALRAMGIVNIDVQPLQSTDVRLSTSESDYLYRIAHILALAESFFGDVEKAKRWLSKPKSQFSGRKPIEMLSTTTGTNRVEELLTQAKEGMIL
ncbi:antitoxin Xre/MbcA/ParS toxin-binding domain-containing protein [Pseudomonas sp. ICMP 460]|uniref:antitoxin Xre/MbcA/ParS toxin-binding domain-containing protein n=1 Tax=Pseudomonas sp. ICMP 460 TaxID=1718917 RepID=UPI000C09015E|nr:antitoxin Xre/MbcA/ParS toxin-binding domain-containing protein [Pseudomonas sp. ICMP 460]PHN33228.1 hypothetical protein AO240_03250 [Pseudomonas sp. ICMP 460]